MGLVGGTSLLIDGTRDVCSIRFHEIWNRGDPSQVRLPQLVCGIMVFESTDIRTEALWTGVALVVVSDFCAVSAGVNGGTAWQKDEVPGGYRSKVRWGIQRVKIFARVFLPLGQGPLSVYDKTWRDVGVDDGRLVVVIKVVIELM